jgi:hypothetical protein
MNILNYRSRTSLLHDAIRNPLLVVRYSRHRQIVHFDIW